MTKKQRKMLWRIILSAALYLILLIAHAAYPMEETMPEVAVFLLFLVPYLIIGYDILWKAARNIRNGQIFDENFLMMVATLAAFMIGEYSESVAVMLFYQIGELFQSYAVGRSRASIAEMMSIAPEVAFVEREGELYETDPEDVVIGDILVIRPGEKIPVDGVVTEGASYLDTAALTGESVPRRVSVGDAVISGCLNGEETLHIRATKCYEDSTVAKVLELVENASEKKAHLENFITRFARYYTPVVTIGAAVLAVIPPLVLGEPFGGWIRRACIFLIVSCPCALVISVPLGFFGGIGAASKRGVLVKGSNYLELLADVKTLVMDKTGTLTKGEFTVQTIHPAKDGDDRELLSCEELLTLAAKAEIFSTHPIAKSVLAAFGGTPDGGDVSDAKIIPGKGIAARLKEQDAQVKLLVGNAGLMEEHHITYVPCEEAGTVLYVAKDDAFLGSIVIADGIKETSAAAVRAMYQNGIRKTVMLTGDNEATASAVAEALAITEVHANLLPADKVSGLEDIMQRASGRVGFVGDGVNDAPVLMRADVGIAMGSLGSDAAIEAADVVIMDDDLRKIPSVMAIARRTLRIVRENIVFAIGVKLLVLLLGALGMATMWEAVFADVGVAVLAIMNAMRVLSYDPGQ